MKRNFETKSIKNILGKLIDSSSNLNSGLNNIKVQKLWKEVMGSNVNSCTNEVILKNKTLYVNLNSSVLRQELSYGKQKIVDLLNKEIGKEIIQKIVLR
jgi:predicted nucleic acid-binding Zn ribbon protein